MIPQTRTDLFLAKITGEDVTLPVPQTRFELYLANIAGESYALPAPNSRATLYLAKILGQDVALPVPQTRSELYLAAIAGMSVQLPAAPTTREEWYLAKWAEDAGYVTITGNPVSFNAVAAKLRQLKIAFSPVQDLHGYDSPWPAGGGKNKFDVNAAEADPSDTTSAPTTKRIFTPHTVCLGLASNNYYNKSRVTNYSVSNGAITFTAGSGYGIGFPLKLTPGSEYKLTYTQSGDPVSSFALFYRADGTYITNVFGASAFTVDADADMTVIVFAVTGTATLSSVQLELGSIKTDWTPYENECPISGWDSVNVWQAGENLLDPDTFDSYIAYTVNADGSITISAGNSSAWGSDVNKPVFLKAGTYTLSRTEASGRCAVRSSLNNYGSDIAAILPSAYNVTFTLTEDAFIKIKINTGASEYPVTSFFMLELGATASDYHPYNGQLIPVVFPDGETYYSGWVDPTTGDGEETRSDVDWANAVRIDAYDFQNKHGVSFVNVLPEKENRPTGLFSHGVIASNSAPTPSLPSYIWIGVNDKSVYWIGILDVLGMTLEEFKTWFATAGVTCVYGTSSQQPIALSPQQINSLAGANTMWSDANGDLTVEYRKDGNVSDAEALGILLGGRYTPATGPEDVSDSEALSIITGR